MKSLRENKGLTQVQLADLVNLSQQTIGHYEVDRAKPDLETLKKFADIFNCTTDYLLGKSIVRNPIDTIAARHDRDEYTEEELEDIEKFKEFVRSKRKQNDSKE